MAARLKRCWVLGLALSPFSGAQALESVVPSLFQPSIAAVVEFRDVQGHNADLGRVAASTVASLPTKEPLPSFVMSDAFKFTATNSPNVDLPDARRILGAARLRATDAILHGEILKYKVENGKAIAEVRLQILELEYGYSVRGSTGSAEIRIGKQGSLDWLMTQRVVVKAVENAMVGLRTWRVPTAIILNTHRSGADLNAGNRAGFNEGMTVIVSRRNQILNFGARVVKVTPERAEIKFNRITAGIAPGDRVAAFYSSEKLDPLR